MRRPEHNLQSACVRWFRLQHPSMARLFIAVPNGVPLGRASSYQFIAEGLTRGVADTLLLVARGCWHGLAIEFKTEEIIYKGGRKTTTRKYQTPEQKSWQELVEAQGWRYEVVRTPEAFIALVEDYLRTPNGRSDI